MPITPGQKLPEPKKGTFKPFPTGLYQVEIIDVKEVMKEPWGNPTGEKQKNYTFEFAVINDGPYYGRRVWKDAKAVAPVPSERGGRDKSPWVWRIMSAVVGHELSYDEGRDFPTDKINDAIGKQVQAYIVIEKGKDGLERNKPKDFTPATSLLPKFDPEKSKALGEAMKQAAPAAQPVQPAASPLQPKLISEAKVSAYYAMIKDKGIKVEQLVDMGFFPIENLTIEDEKKFAAWLYEYKPKTAEPAVEPAKQSGDQVMNIEDEDTMPPFPR